MCKLLVERGYEAVSLQSEMSQHARSKAVEQFRSGESRVMVATDVAARGLDVAGVSHVINYSVGMSIDM